MNFSAVAKMVDSEPTRPMSNSGVPIGRTPLTDPQSERDAWHRMREKFDNPTAMGEIIYRKLCKTGRTFRRKLRSMGKGKYRR